MNKVSELTRILGQHLQWNKARLTCFSSMVLALLVSRTICLAKMVVLMDSRTQQASRYHGVKRFFREFSVELTAIAHFIF